MKLPLSSPVRLLLFQVVVYGMLTSRVWVLSFEVRPVAPALHVTPLRAATSDVAGGLPTTASVSSTGFRFLDPTLVSKLEQELNITAPNAIQEQALQVFFSRATHRPPDNDGTSHPKKSMLVCSQTGSGKTMTFLLPILQTLYSNPEAHALVVAPTRLLLDQHEWWATRLDSAGVLKNGRLHFLASTRVEAETGIDAATVQILNNPQIQIVALDEVDAVLYGGTSQNHTRKKNSMDDDTTLSPLGSRLLEQFQGKAHLIATAAFLSRSHQKALLERDLVPATMIREPKVTSFQTQVLVPTLRQRYQYFSGNRIHKLQTVLHTIYHPDNTNRQDVWLRDGSTMIFCRDVESAREVYEMLQQEVQDSPRHNLLSHTGVQLLHEELDYQDIQQLVSHLREAISTKNRNIIVCTDIAARGLDVPNVRHVILHDVPTTVSSFVHQVGRTARKGESGVLTSLVHTATGDAQKYTHLHALKGASSLF